MMPKKGCFNILVMVVIISMVATTWGCAWFRNKAEIEKPVEQLLQEGLKAYDDGQYRAAIDNFKQLKDWYPFSKHAILAELKIADAHYYLSEYAEAVQAYEQFEQLHPRNEAIPYVIYQIGRCYYDQVGTIDRDQTSAQKALEVFARLIKQYPETDYAHKARVHLIRCQRSLSEHDFYIGMFYYRSEHYLAALKRFENVVTQYPDVGTHEKALLYIANCEALIKAQKAASPQ
jgi:outer membrane protein assembly factor BamD